MSELVKILENLGVLDDIKTTLLFNDIDSTEENMASTGFGFAKITESFESTLALSEEVYNFVSRMRKKQDKELMEQPFALTGNLGIDNDNTPIIYLNEFLEDTDGIRKATSGCGGDAFYQRVNAYLNNHENINKVLLMGHTHPDMEKLSAQEGFIDENVGIREASESLVDNPLKLRKRGLNISVGDVVQLIKAQNSASRTNFILSGIALPNGEFNILFYNGTTIQSLDNVFVVRGEKLESIPNFKTDTTIIKK